MGPASNYSIWGLPHEYHGLVQWKPPRIYPPGTKDSVNVLKGAMLTSDLISTVSEGYASEILSAEGGSGLHEVLCSRYVTGVTSGIDVTGWNPSTDEHTTSHYSIEDLFGKVNCKVALQYELRLPCRPECPLIEFVGRLDTQKGVDILLSAIPDLLQDDIQFVVLGFGEREYEEWMRDTQSSFPDKFRGRWAFSPLTTQSMIQALTTALTVYRDRGDTESCYRLMKRGMKRNSSWDYTAQRYETLLAQVRGTH